MKCEMFVRTSACALLACGLSFAAARAAWDPDGNRLSSQPTGSVASHAAIPFGAGGVLAVWATYDAANDRAGEIRAQALDAEGNVPPGWPAQGVLLAHASGAGQFPELAPDGSGGAYVLWLASTGIGNFRIQHLTETGAIAGGWPAAGRAIAGYIGSGTRLVPDGAGGLYVATLESPQGEGTSRLQRLDSEGNAAAGWPAEGLALDVPARYFAIELGPDGEGGVYAAWPEVRVTQHDVIVLHRFTAAAMPHAAWPPGGVVVGGSGDPSLYVGATHLILDGNGGVYVGWYQSRSGCLPCDEGCPCPRQYVTRLDGNGAVANGWTTTGLRVGEWASQIVPDGAGGLLIGTTSSQGEVDHIPDYRAFVARVGPDGSAAPGWSLAGNPVCSRPRGQSPPAITSDGAGGAFVSWADKRVDMVAEPYVSLLTALGSIADGWPAEGSLVSAAARWVDLPQLIPGRPGEAIVLWTDVRSGQYHLYAAALRTASAGLLAAPGVALTDIRPNPAKGAFWATVSIREPEDAGLELLDLGGRRIASWTVAGGRKSVLWVQTSDPLAPGLYWLRLRQGSGPASAAPVVILR